MGKAAAARKLAAAAAFGGGGLSLLGGALYGVLNVEAKLARKTIGETSEDPPPDATGWYGRGRPGPAIQIALLGDSSAAGYGVQRVEETPGALLASGLSEHADRRVYLRDYAVVGARTPAPERPDRPSPADRARRRGDPDRRQRRDPQDAARRSRCDTSPRECAGCARPGSRSSWAPAPTSARSSRSRRR